MMFVGIIETAGYSLIFDDLSW